MPLSLLVSHCYPAVISQTVKHVKDKILDLKPLHRFVLSCFFFFFFTVPNAFTLFLCPLHGAIAYSRSYSSSV